MPFGITWDQIGWVATGFFGMVSLALLWANYSLKKAFPKERRWYSTDIPSTLHIEKEA